MYLALQKEKRKIMYLLTAVSLKLENAKNKKRKKKRRSNSLGVSVFLGRFTKQKRMPAKLFAFGYFDTTWSISDLVLAPTGF